ncbi:iron complex transport system substrate-binding protein [Dethiosulfovibrio salsuginis]|uniref:Iron complex transport system substrate-binding protein n=1 Tax=Dethiosulfovibrio salsuginis TaxID=561720 RepID=A0A1X7JVG2_9BACT|nr:iron complex transport system substrate-binding protein [Dethiosulfovibrio salsuginis]
MKKHAGFFAVIVLFVSSSSFAMEIKEASNLIIEEVEGHHMVTVPVPYYGASAPVRYLLVPKGEAAVQSIPDVVAVEVPLERVVIGTTSAVACLDVLGSLNSLIGLAGGKYVYTDSLRELNLPEVASDGGMSRSLDRERLISLSPGGFITYLYGEEERRDVDFLAGCGIPVLFMAEYLEESPLGRAEWIKFIGLLVGKGEEAEAFFDKVASRYRELEALGALEQDRPVIMSGAPFGGTWYVPKGYSWPSILFRAAGGISMWDDLKGTGTAPMDLEAVLDRAVSADLWVNCGTWRSLDDGRSSGVPVEAISPFKAGRVYNNDNRINEHGGNDYYQLGVIRPDLILSDLLSIIHPLALPDHELVFYRKLQ